MKTSIVILTHNQLSLTQQCLTSIRRHTQEPYELIVVDNASTDQTPGFLKRQPDIKPIFNQENLGFAKGCNQGIKLATGENILLLNNDTVVTENWLRNMLRLLYSYQKIGMVGPVSNYVSGLQKINVTYRDLSGLDQFAQEYCKKNLGSFQRVYRLVAFCLLIKKAVLDDVGYFDEIFGLGNYEDDDLCLRTVMKGYSLMIARDSYVHHIGNATFNSIKGVSSIKLLKENRAKAIAKWGYDISAYLSGLK